MPYVIGTAGHVDHGKSTLVRALSGIDPDRLKEEKDRQLTIDLGFAWFTLPGGEVVGVVDVPGHRDFIENMLAGVGGIDCVILVIAADEGVMPQTREHLAIVDLLDIPSAVVALTKVDLIEDEEWLTLVEADVRQVLSSTALRQAPIIHVSGVRGDGLDELVVQIEQALNQKESSPWGGALRLPIDRVFTMSGFGTVVTGTLLGGQIAVGDDIVVQPGGVEGRIRGIQAYKEAREIAEPGMRVALNVSGIGVEDIRRGQVVSHVGVFEPTQLIDVNYYHLPDASQPLEHNTEVKIFSGAFEVMGYVRCIGAEQIQPGENAWLQLRFTEPVAMSRGDRYVLRIPSPPETIGGGNVLDAYPSERWSRYKESTLNHFSRLDTTSLDALIQYELETNMALTTEEIAAHLYYEVSQIQKEIEHLSEREMTTRIDGGLWVLRGRWNQLVESLVRRVDAFHDQHPLQSGIGREELRKQAGLEMRVFKPLVNELVASGQIITVGNRIRLPHFAIVFTPRQQKHVDELRAAIDTTPTAPPTVKDAADMVGEEIFNALVTRGDIILVANGVFFDRDTFYMLRDEVVAMINEHGGVSVSDVRDRFETSRKYVLGLLEYLDELGITRRQGDTRILNDEELPSD